MSAPVSSNNLTAEVCPFMAANISGDMPNLLPVLYTHTQNMHKMYGIYIACVHCVEKVTIY